VITIIAIIIAGLMGALGFSGKHVVGALGVGLLLSMATTVVNMIFGAVWATVSLELLIIQLDA
jgi:hypothetical protein